MKHLPLNHQPFETLYKDFNTFIQAKGYRLGKSQMLQSCVREFLFFIEIQGYTQIREIKALQIVSYIDYLRERPNQRREGGLSESMIRHHLYALRLFFDHLIDAEELESSPARLPKFQFGKNKERSLCTVEEMKQIYAACKNSKEKALLGIAYGCGLRRSEIQNLNTGDVLLHKGILLVREGKNNKSRNVPIPDSVIKDLKEYIIYERSQNVEKNYSEESPSFFLNKYRKRMSGDKHNRALQEIILRTGNPELIRKEITLHCLRHSIATHLMDNGSSIEFVQQLLGHSEIDTAHLYSKRRKQQLKITSQIY